MNQFTPKANQRGFAMLEVMLAVLIIAIASFGIYKLYNSASDNDNLSKLQTTVSQIRQAIDNYAVDTGDYVSDITDLQSQHYLPDSYFVSTGSGDQKTTTIKSTYAVTLVPSTTGPKNSFTLKIDGVPASIAVKFYHSMIQMADVTDFDPTSVKGSNSFTLTFPKGSQ